MKVKEKQVINIEVDKEMYKHFKQICVEKEVPIKVAIEKLMANVVTRERGE